MIIDDKEIKIISDGTVNSFFIKEGYTSQPKNFSLDENQENHYWDSMRVINSAWANAAAYMSVRRDIEDNPSTAGRLLEIGCGVMLKAHKFYLEYVSDLYIGIDQPSALQVAQDMGIFTEHPAAIGLALNLDDASKVAEFTESFVDDHISMASFNTVVCIDVIEHLFNPSIILSMIHDVTDDNSVVYFGTPERDIKRGVDCTSSEKRDHVREWNTEEFTQMLDHFNFTVESVELLECSDMKIGDKGTLFYKCKKLV